MFPLPLVWRFMTQSQFVAFIAVYEGMQTNKYVEMLLGEK